MTEETKTQLMQSIYKLAEHYEIPNASLVSFKKRNLLLELLNTKSEIAFKNVKEFIDSALTLDRIQNDKEKQEKKLDHWNLEIAEAQGTKTKAAEKLIAFLKSEGIDTEGLTIGV